MYSIQAIVVRDVLWSSVPEKPKIGAPGGFDDTAGGLQAVICRRILSITTRCQTLVSTAKSPRSLPMVPPSQRWISLLTTRGTGIAQQGRTFALKFTTGARRPGVM